MGLGQSSSVVMGGWVRAILPCPYLAEDLTLQTFPTRDLAVAMVESKFTTKKGDPRVSAAEVVMKEDHLPWTGRWAELLVKLALRG